MVKSIANRFTKLDGLRGLLSLIVALNHSFLVVAIPNFANVWSQNYFIFESFESKLQQLLMILGNGGVAVSMFFVLSGFVLSQSFRNHEWTPKGYLTYLIKRLARLYPVFLFTISIIAIFTKMGFEYRTFPYASSWYHWWMNFPLDWSEFIRNALFININLGGVTWTLRVIVIVSLFIPLLYLLSTKLSKTLNILVSLALVYLSFNLLNIDGFRDLRYTYMFYFGLIIPFYETNFKQIPKKIFYVFLPLLVFTLLTVRYQTDEYRGGVVEAIISWLLIGLIVYRPEINIFNFLENRFFIFLGRISYSLYLVHFSVLYVLARLMFQFFPEVHFTNYYLLTHTMLLLTSLVVTIPLSHFMNIYIETPPYQFVSRLLKRKQQ